MNFPLSVNSDDQFPIRTKGQETLTTTLKRTPCASPTVPVSAVEVVHHAELQALFHGRLVRLFPKALDAQGCPLGDLIRKC